MKTTTIHNAQITRTSLGPEDHGVMTFFLHCKFDSCGCGFGGFNFGDSQGVAKLISRILEIAGVGTWEQVSGKLIRVKSEGLGGRIAAIGHILEDKWLTRDEVVAILQGKL